MDDDDYSDETESYPASYINIDFDEKDVSGTGRFERLHSALENIAKELRPEYSGKLIVERYAPKETDITYSDWEDLRNDVGDERRRMMHPFLAIKEIITEKKWFGLVTNEKPRIILAFGEVFTGEENGYRQLDVMVADARSELMLRAYSEILAKEHGLNGINIQRIN